MVRLIAAVAAAAILAGCTRDATDATYRLPLPSNVMIIVLDACRPDKLDSFGFARETSPNLTAFSRDPDAVRYLRHHVAAAATRSSTASLFTGLQVDQHGVRTVLRRPDQPAPGGKTVTAYALDQRFQTLAERLREQGFATFGVVHTSHISPEYGFAQGFDDYGDPGTDPTRIARFVALARAAPRPFFGYLHVIACHHPFPIAERDAAYLTRYGAPYDEASRRGAGVDFTSADVMWRIRDGALHLDDADTRFLHLVYEARLKHMDEHTFAVLIAALRQAGVYNDSLIIVTADHGEELYDHGGYAHGHALWEAVIHVPLLIKFPAGARPPGLGREVNELTSNVDLMPTILAAVGAPVPEGLPGRSIFAPVGDRAVMAETIGVDGATPLWTLLAGDHKLIASGTTRRLYDLGRDPQERDDLAPGKPDLVATLERRASALRSAVPAAAPTIQVDLPADVQEKLRSLGYASPDG